MLQRWFSRAWQGVLIQIPLIFSFSVCRLKMICVAYSLFRIYLADYLRTCKPSSEAGHACCVHDAWLV